MSFKLIEGGRQGNDGVKPVSLSFNDKLRQLKKIRNVLFAESKGTLSPRGRRALGAALLTFMIAIKIDSAFRTYLEFTGGTFITTVVAIMLAIGTFFLVRRYSTAPLTHIDHLDCLLADYEPVSKEAYRELQARVEERGELDNYLVVAWIDREEKEIEIAAGWRMPSKRRFLKKKV